MRGPTVDGRVVITKVVWRMAMSRLCRRLGAKERAVIVLSGTRRIQLKIWKSGRSAWTFQRKIGRVRGSEITVYSMEDLLKAILAYRHQLIGGTQPLLFEHEMAAERTSTQSGV